TPADADARAGQKGTYLAAAVAVGAVEPVVQAVIKAIGAMLLIAFHEAGEQYFAHVGLAVAVGVFRVKNIRGGADNHAFAPGDDAVGEIDAFQKNSGLVVNAVVVGVFQKAHNAAGFAVAVNPFGVITHFHHPQFSVRAPIKRHR